MKNIAVIFPNQLFETDYLPYDPNNIDTYIIVEDSLYFSDNERVLRFNLLKLIYLRAAMKYYYDYLTDSGYDVVYLDWTGESSLVFEYVSKNYGSCNLNVIDPVDYLLEERITKYSNDYDQKVIYYESPGFILTNLDLKQYTNSKQGANKKFFQHSFYAWFRKKFNILMDGNKPIGGKYSYDKYNRQSIPNKNFYEFLDDNNINLETKKYANKYYTEAQKYCENTFENFYPDNYNPENIQLYPINHTDIISHFDYFVENKLPYFGMYEDAIDFDDPYLFHSVISPQLNSGLITPRYVLDKIIDKYNESNTDLLYEVEGYIRQLVWREYSRLLYRYIRKDMMKNYFGNKNRLSEIWYTGNTGIEPVDLAINSAFQYGYIHHIIRLMILCNFMNICMIDPNDVYQWFMEFSLDSYDWVMINNVYSMGLFADGGLTTTKPYITSSNYVLKMSNIKKDGYWNVVWDILYYNFIYHNYDKFKGRGKIYLSQWDRQKKKQEILKLAPKIMNRL